MEGRWAYNCWGNPDGVGVLWKGDELTTAERPDDGELYGRGVSGKLPRETMWWESFIEGRWAGNCSGTPGGGEFHGRRMGWHLLSGPGGRNVL